MKITILIKVVLILFLMLALLAPFTFLKPTVVDITIDEPLTKVITSKAKKAPIEKVIEKPLHEVKLPDFGAILDIQTKKKKFFDFIKPAVIKQNKKLLETRAKLNTWLEHVSLELPLSEQEHQELKRLVKKYRVNKNASTLSQLNALLLRVDIIPMPLVLVQAANESAWGTSRFSRIGLNFFGIWCYQEGCGMVPNSRNTGASHEVAAFQSLDEAVTRYFDNINSHNAYRVFRTIRFELRSQEQELNPEVLATGLLPYSERGVDYVIDITKMLRQNAPFLREEEKDDLPAELLEG
ncbi:glucosaminidase domain-containing protein [Colwellia sp. 4_MG-2023]|uniref:glucosaminidase domain-containing protein n=1 Tax=unclassified Colwellia TaxID=196834 RepID=UPI001C0930A4|nr:MULTISPECIES: glucosaminidase domain-containing protein [unclassified Colwellia]MBU2924303.1 glucosaminidase domain-containing protein [Colwellia sp. C2M11]MDO6505474.1 glucosaminidase domain-containing protein [Colwellia sp. 5_MG-2023]MDO6554230.1 glucosaminidase domain-containing protein [Colwellia sp. 4_MG-2023]MDO6650895.1 glucosaminidase domain-containing protein [Colwellia sp. 3_MG-2023]MDO6663930.1 glucosaminidase domain-containing protein [Colwellia sp. 2_MG-2023]